MLLSLTMPAMGELMRAGTVERLDIAEGMALGPGSRLLDVRVDLSAAAPQDCPPVYSFRVVSREKGWVRRLSAAPGQLREVGDLLALISTDPDEALDGPPARALRVATAGILSTPDWLAGGP